MSSLNQRAPWRGQISAAGILIGCIGCVIITASSVYTALKMGALPWPTIFTSNYSPQALSKRLGRKGETETAEAIASRLSETTIPIHLTGPDMRIASRM